MRLCLEKITVTYLQHLNSVNDLVTPYSEVRSGFVALALERNHRATPFVEQARALKIRAAKVSNPNQLLEILDIRTTLLAASGVSDKAAKHFQEEDKIEAIKGLVQNFLEPAGRNFVDELVYRYLLTRGDTLGGSMRNAGGLLAERKLSRSIISALNIQNTPYKWLDKNSKTWLNKPSDDTNIEINIKGLSWNIDNRTRTLKYNLKVPIVKKNIDLCLFDCLPENLDKDLIRKPDVYVALGELKGGIDPAGADEHWKTANSALNRITTAFIKYNKILPNTFFLGAAIQNSMAEEIWLQLQNKTLTNAANLTQLDQVASLCGWLIRL